MTYEYKIVYTLTGGFALPPRTESLELFSNKVMQVSLLKDAEEFCKVIDVNAAIVSVYMRRRFLNSSERLSKDLIHQEVDNIKNRRILRATISNFLAIKITKECQLKISNVVYKDDSYSFSIGENGNSIHIDSHKREIDNILSAININSITSLQFDKIAEGIYYPNIEGRTFFIQKVDPLRVKVYNANGITTAAIIKIKESIINLSKHRDLDKILGFHTQMRNKRNDELKSFIFGWTALEIFINKNFKKYDKTFWLNLTQGNPIFIKFSDRLNSILQDRLRLNDKFLIIVSCLNQDSDILDDLELFDKIKKIRDNYFHGQPVDNLPTEDIDNLLKKYLYLHLKYLDNNHTT